ncbi:MAG: ATP-binding protein [Chloroflexota bacterium]|nr:ATP-binding protein [Chloroflexota bacterium]
MTDAPLPPNAQTLSGAIVRVNRLGFASEKLFSRLYRGIGRRARTESNPNAPPAYLIQPPDRRDVATDTELRRLQGVLATIDEGVIMQDNEGRVVLINAAARALLGSIKTFWSSELGTLFANFRDQVTTEPGIAPLSEPTRVQINHRIIGARLGAVADDDGDRLGTIIVLRDITSDVLTERLKDQFVAAITHELRTPMAVIKGASEVLMAQAQGGKPTNMRMLQTLSRNVDVLDRMIVELLDISELNDAHFVVQKEGLTIEELLWSVVNGMQSELKRAGLDVSVMLRDTSVLHLLGDDQRLSWALGHLLQNAARYTESGGHIVLTAFLGSDRRGARYGMIQVSDTGVGISERDLPHVFERFYRGEARTPSGKLLDPRGLGQGLFIARRVTEAHGGYLSVYSTPGQGSVFTMALPVV